jgi:hypothetical protein
MRERLVEALEALADPNYQERVWLKRELPADLDDDGLDFVVHFFFDDTDLSRDPLGCVGWFIRDEHEAQLVREVVEALDRVIRDVGPGESDQEYLSNKSWPMVVSSARQALTAVQANG